jgi:hypothetical protein
VAAIKTTVISVRVPPDIKAALSAAAAVERRSLATMVEVMVLNYCRTNAIPLPTKDAAASGQPAPKRQDHITSRKS